ncbi:hypothetical protein AC629_13555 [Bradyrhizobium sp. NAS80.1]|uniref:hypothetical protein n=1 Tax=Bradyrhizobium sp. NAS80.1 TaxID=1680159 RepID=UPI00095F4D0D|nr:hypothetical protein [Bradyrhizobium sp. NAS80.1]OKO87565.1 hypothetical protein AC629_13555 [Bradyrhizobium sp. NAS80.1]
MDADYHAASNGWALRAQFEEICHVAVQNEISALLGADQAQRTYGGQYGDLLRWMIQAALEYALANNIEPHHFEDDVLRDGLSIVGALRYAFINDPSNRSPNFLDHGNPIDLIKADKVPRIDRMSLECVVGDYLALPYRSQAMDRVLVRGLIAAETYAFGDEMLNEKTFGLFPARSPMKQTHVLLGYLRGQFTSGIVFGGIAVLGFGLSSGTIISEGAAAWIAGICLSLFLFFVATSTLALPYLWFNQAKARRRVRDLLATMTTLYNEQRSDGPISAYYVRERANDASRQGVVWPAPLFAILDDIISRTGRY